MMKDVGLLRRARAQAADAFRPGQRGHRQILISAEQDREARGAHRGARIRRRATRRSPTSSPAPMRKLERRRVSGMTQRPMPAPRRRPWREALAVYLKPRVLIVLFLGFSAGLPLALSGSTLLVWMRESRRRSPTIGLFALVGTPYTIKFLWAPLVDALDVPVLSRLLGRRRGWLVLSQLLLMVAIVLLGLCDPAIGRRGLVAFGALLVADRLGDAGHRDRRVPGRKPAGKRAGRRHGVLRRGLSHRHAGLDRRRAVSGQRLRAVRASAAARAWTRGLCRHGGAGRRSASSRR